MQTNNHVITQADLTMPELLTEKEAARLLKKHHRWLERKRWEGGGPEFCYIPIGNEVATRYANCNS